MDNQRPADKLRLDPSFESLLRRFTEFERRFIDIDNKIQRISVSGGRGKSESTTTTITTGGGTGPTGPPGPTGATGAAGADNPAGFLAAIPFPTPTLGADDLEITLPYHKTTGASLNFTLRRLTLRVVVAGGDEEIEIEKYSGTGAFSGTSMGTLTLGTGEYEGSITSFTGGTAVSGDKFRIVTTDIGTATGWLVTAEWEASV
jgi:hypothetical protein